MAISKRTRAKGCKDSQKLLPEAQVLWFAVGRAGPQPTLTGWSIVGAFVVFSIVVMMATGTLVMPGLLLFAGIHHHLCPPRALVVCDQGIALVTRSFLTSRPNGVVSRSQLAAIRPAEMVAGQVRIEVGPDHIWLSKAEESSFRAALRSPAMAR